MSTIDKAHCDTRPMLGDRSAWLCAHLSFCLVLVVLGLAYGTTIVSMVSVWAHSGTFHYAFLIFPISVVLIWINRPALRNVSPQFNAWGVAGLAIVSLLWLAGALVSASILQHFSVVAAVPLAVLACYGARIARLLIFPLAYLFFAVPFGDFLVGPLQTFTAHFSVKGLQLSGATVFLDGHLIEVPAGTFAVEEACSGIKFFIATTALGTLYAYLFYRSWTRRILFVIAALVAPLIANGLRVYFTVMIGQYLGMRYASGTDHLIFGWQFFGTVLVLLFLAGWYWHEAPAASSDPSPSSADVADMRPRWHGVAYVLVALMVLALGPVVEVWTAGPAYVPGPSQRVSPVDVASGGWSLVPDDPDPLGTRFAKADTYLSATYGRNDAQVSVYAALYRGRPQGKHDLLTYGNDIYDASIWSWVADSQRSVRVGQQHVRVNEELLQGPQQNRLVWYWYEIDGHRSTSRLWAKLLQIESRLSGGAMLSSVISVSTESVADDPGEARARLARFLRTNAAAIRQSLLKGG